ncbi:MAG: hypothetical protein M1820_004442 [Bogoriella megaspora]|nr:MAG: hypothetical protein M1820_004442 [Bogoriella megaspora]
MGPPINSVAIIGAGASGAAASAACADEDVFDTIRVFERRNIPGGTWIYQDDSEATNELHPGKLPPEVDPPLSIPKHLPQTTPPTTQDRHDRTPIYKELTTNVPAIAMAFSDVTFPYGPFVPHWVPKQYIQNYFSLQKTDSLLVLNTTVEDVSAIPAESHSQFNRWKLTLRRFDPARHVDIWWQEEFDAVILANGHYSVPFVPEVKGLEAYMSRFSKRVSHSVSYRTADLYTNKRVLIIGNSASGIDITTLLVKSGKPKLPVYQSRRSRSRWDGAEPPEGIEWKPVIKEYDASKNEIIFEDNSRLGDIDAVIYCTGYKPSYPFWNEQANGGPLFNYEANHLQGNFQHTFFQSYPHNLGIVGFPRVLTFRSFEYQSVALARLFAGRNAKPLPPLSEQRKWEQQRAELVKREHRKFHDIPWDNEETLDWLRFLFEMSGLPDIEGWGRCPPVLGKETRWAIEHVRKYPEPGKEGAEVDEEGWVVVEGQGCGKDSLHFI